MISVRILEKMTMKMIPALNLVRTQNQTTQEVMIHLMLMYRLVRFPLVISLNRNIEGDAAEAVVEVEADQGVLPHHEVNHEVGLEVVREADQHVHIHVQHHEDRDLSK